MRQKGTMSTTEIVTRAQFAAGLTQEQLGEAVGASRRTVSRWAANRSSPSDTQLVEMVRLAHAREPDVAATLAAGMGETLESLGIVPPAPPPAPPAPSLRIASTALVLEGIVHAAASAMNLSPRVVRTGLYAAMKRARELGATVEEMEGALETAAPPSLARGAGGA
jgi:transcriptional regulator with XRE-family HTH domain